MSGMMKPILIVAMLIVVVVPRGGEAKIDCEVVVVNLISCVPYMVRKGPIGQCCDGVKTLNSYISSTVDRQIACLCLQSMMIGRPDIDYKTLAGLPKECSVEAPYIAITLTFDCLKLE